MTQIWIIYLLESAVILMFFWTVYWLFLRSETFFRLNRIYLQLTLVLSLIIPLFDWVVDIKTADVTSVYILDTIVVTAQKAEISAVEIINHFQWIPIILVSGTIVSLILFSWGIIKLLAFVKRSKTARNGKVVFVVNNRFTRPFSFLNYVFMSEELYNSKDTHIINHEMVHVKQKHSLDLLFSGLIGAFQWFNPFAWLYREAFREIHEYLADEAVLKQGEDPVLYKKSLFNEATGFSSGVFSFFNVSFTKRRFKMMSRIKSPRSNALKVLVILPVAVLMVVVFACTPDQEIDKEVDLSQQKNNNEISSSISDEKLDKEPTYMVVEEMPEYEGGGDALYADLVKSIVFPKVAKEKGIEAKVYVQFIIDKQGNVIDPVVKRISDLEGNEIDIEESINNAFSNAATNAIASLGQWKPGKQDGQDVNVKFMIPIAFKLD